MIKTVCVMEATEAIASPRAGKDVAAGVPHHSRCARFARIRPLLAVSMARKAGCPRVTRPMRMRHLYAVIVACVAAVTLSGCYVYGVVPPAPNGPAVDDRLVGTWYGLDEHGKPVRDAFLHFIKPKDGGPMHMLSSETDNYGAFELHTGQIPGQRVFGVRKIYPPEPAGSNIADDNTKYLLGVYDVRHDALVIRVFEPDKLRDAVNANRLRGTVGSGNFAAVTLTGSPQDISRALASPEAQAALSKPLTFARRLPHPR
jgi:hypothetical protein